MSLAKTRESRRVPSAIGLAIVTGLTAALMGVLTSTCSRDAGKDEGDSSGETRTVQAYFSNPGLDPKPVVDCEAVFPVERTVPRTQTPARAALEALFAGPTAEERAHGYTTNIPEGVEIRSLVIENGVATADFSQELERTGGSCAVAAIRAQIDKTLKQFPTVKSVRIAIDGRTEDILQP